MIKQRNILLIPCIGLVVSLLIALFVYAIDESPTAQLSAVDPTRPLGTDPWSSVDNYLRETRRATINTVGAEHYAATGYHKFKSGAQFERGTKIASPTEGNLYLNASTGNLQMQLPTAGLLYTGGNSGSSYTATQNTTKVTGNLSTWSTDVLPGMEMTLKGGATTYTIVKVVSNTELTVTPVVTVADEELVGSGVYTITLLKEATPYWANVGPTFFSRGVGTSTAEHYANGTHRIPIRTDNTDPKFPSDGNIWIDTLTTNRLRFRDGGVTKELSTTPTYLLNNFFDITPPAFNNTAYNATSYYPIGRIYIPQTATSLRYVFYEQYVSGGTGGINTKMLVTLGNAFVSPTISVTAEETIGQTGSIIFDKTLTIPSGLKGTDAYMYMQWRVDGASAATTYSFHFGRPAVSAAPPTTVQQDYRGLNRIY